MCQLKAHTLNFQIYNPNLAVLLVVLKSADLIQDHFLIIYLVGQLTQLFFRYVFNTSLLFPVPVF